MHSLGWFDNKRNVDSCPRHAPVIPTLGMSPAKMVGRDEIEASGPWLPPVDLSQNCTERVGSDSKLVCLDSAPVCILHWSIASAPHIEIYSL